MDLKINYEETIQVGNRVDEQAQKFKELLSKIETVNSELKTAWEGSDASKYTDAVSEQAVTMKKLGETMTELGGFLVKVGNAYKEAMEANRDAIRYNS